MPRSIVLGNGKMLVCLDEHGFVRDLYFPFVGLENHVLGKKHRIGVFVDSKFSWLDDGSWEISQGYQPETMVGYMVAKSENLGLSLVFEDIVYNESDVFVRKVEVYNHYDSTREIKIFFSQVFYIHENKKRNTAFYDPTHNVVVHYKGRRVFIINGQSECGKGIEQYAVGAFEFEGKEGTFKDAEDGELGLNAVEHGSVDSVIRMCAKCEGKSKSTIYYWISIAKTLDEAYSLNQMVINKTADGILNSTEAFWNAWLNKKNFHTGNLSEKQKKLFDNSLFILRAHSDNRGSIIASADSEMMEYGKDDYAYMWPRDAAFIVSTLDKAGFSEVTKSFFQFCQRVLHPDGYLHHRYRSDESLGSTWHSATFQKEWLKDKILQLPIQEDETAAVIFALWKHYEMTKDIEFIEELYKPFIEKAGQFLTNFVDEQTGLPLPSYDLWEEKIGISTYTCSAVYGGLMAAAKFSEVLGKRNHMRDYKHAAKKIKQAAIDYLYDKELQSFIRIAYKKEGEIVQEKVIDSSSLFGLWYFGMLDQADPLFESTLKMTNERLTNKSPAGGVIRYENDNYFRDKDKSNPWIITTLWEAQRRLKQNEVKDEDIEFAKNTLNWVVEKMTPSEILPEQIDPYTSRACSATPLVWSHAVYVETVLTLIEILEKKQLCVDCTTPQIPTI